MADLALADELVERLQGDLDRRVGVVVVGVHDVDVVRLQPLERLLGARTDVLRRQPAVAAQLGGDDELVAIAARGQPLPDDALGLAAVVPRHPAGVAVGGIDEVAAGRHVSVEDGEGIILVRGPAEHVAAEAEWEHLEAGAPEGATRDVRRRHGPQR